MRRMQERSSIAGAKTQDRLSRRCIIFTQGPTATFKSTLTDYLARRLNVQIAATHGAGKIVNNGVLDHVERARRYECILNEARTLARANKSVVLDGVFDELQWRQVVYGLVRDSGASLIVIKTQCGSIEPIKARLQQRAENPDLPDSEMADMWFWNFTSKAVMNSPVEDDDDFVARGGELITFETGMDRSVTCSPGASANAKLVAQLIEDSPLMICQP